MGNISAHHKELLQIVPEESRDSKKRRKSRLSLRSYFFREKRIKTSAIKPAPAPNPVDCARSLPDFDLARPHGNKALSAKSCPAGFTPFIRPLNTHDEAMQVEDPLIQDTPTALTLDFRLTEGQERRGLLADSEFECSQIADYLFVGGASVATSWETISNNGITRVVNCSSAVVENCFVDYANMKYLSLNMVDGRQDDVGWFVCQVIQFVEEGRARGEKTLIHCEKGVSRSCSFIIAHRIWLSSSTWKEAFDYVKQRRKVCAPNTAFTCNLIEFSDLLFGASKSKAVMFRCAYHLHHDIGTAVLKACRDPHSRKLLEPSVMMLDSRGIFVLRPDPADYPNVVFVWQGASSSSDVMETVVKLVESMKGIYTNVNKCDIEIILEGFESPDFMAQFKANSSPSFNKECHFEDLWTVEHEANIESLQLLNNEGFTADSKIGSSSTMMAVDNDPLLSPHDEDRDDDYSPRRHDLAEEEDNDNMFFVQQSAPTANSSSRAKLAQLNTVPGLSLSLNMTALKLQPDENTDIPAKTDSIRLGDESSFASPYSSRQGSPHKLALNTNAVNSNKTGPFTLNLSNSSKKLPIGTINTGLLAIHDHSEQTRRVETVNISSNTGKVLRPANPALTLNALPKQEGSGSLSNRPGSQRGLSLPLSQLSHNLSDRSLSVELSTNRSQIHSSRHPEPTGPGGMTKSDSVTSVTSNTSTRKALPIDIGLARCPLPLSELLHSPPLHNSGSRGSLHGNSQTNLHGLVPNLGLNLSRQPSLANMDVVEPEIPIGNSVGHSGKPLLMQATIKCPEKGTVGCCAADYGWESLGMYDDEDLHEVCFLRTLVRLC
jgi:predicted protein tyrosine phosphatase